MVNIDKLKSLAKSKGIKLGFIAKKIGVPHTYFADIKNRNRDIPDDRLTVISDILDTTPEYLRDKTDDPSPSYAQTSRKLQDRLTAINLPSYLVDSESLFKHLGEAKLEVDLPSLINEDEKDYCVISKSDYDLLFLLQTMGPEKLKEIRKPIHLEDCLSKRELLFIQSYRNNPQMQPAVNTLLDITPEDSGNTYEIPVAARSGKICKATSSCSEEERKAALESEFPGIFEETE